MRLPKQMANSWHNPSRCQFEMLNVEGVTLIPHQDGGTSACVPIRFAIETTADKGLSRPTYPIMIAGRAAQPVRPLGRMAT